MGKAQQVKTLIGDQAELSKITQLVQIVLRTRLIPISTPGFSVVRLQSLI
jgi:hypothetical protein